jgi:hypothetical protein
LDRIVHNAYRLELDGPSMRKIKAAKPFLDRMGHKARRQMCPRYVSGLIGLAIARAFSRWRSVLRLATMINGITS